MALTDFSNNQINLLDTGSFSVIVGNVNNATDFLAPAASIPEPGSIILLATGMSLAGRAVVRTKRRPKLGWGLRGR
jgi:PEP-CTERM motif